MLRKHGKVELIRSVPLFEGCSKREVETIASLADEIDVPSGRQLAQEGASGREFVVIVEGAAVVRRGGRKINSLGPGDFLGEIALIRDVPRTATVTTTEPSRLLVVTASAFRSLLRRSPSIQAKVLDAVAKRLPVD